MSIIDQLEYKQVVSFTLSESKKSLKVTEACDDWHSDNLDKAEVTKLIAELTEIRDTMKDYGE